MSKNEQLIEKLRRLTVQRGATEAEARAAREKIVVLKAKSGPPNNPTASYRYSTRPQRTPPKATDTTYFYSTSTPQTYGKYVEGWPGQQHCEHRLYTRHGAIYVCQQCGMEILP